MRFTESPVINLTVGNKTLSFHQDNASMHVGTTVWPASLVLVKFIERWSSSPNNNPYQTLTNFTNKRAIELGTGCGVAAMGLYLLGLTNILLTDIPPVLPALKHNLKKNKPTLGKMLKIGVLDWNKVDQVGAVNAPFDIVVAADVVYIVEHVQGLVEAMWSLVSDEGVVLLGYQVRCVDADVRFWDECGKVFSVEKVPREDLHPEYAFEESDVFVLRKKKM
uniref:Protein-lysine methyltransferase METTL21D n=1 Tax=Tanacetum cinerariifolium TaxID=118510 RepID=A0A6L2KR48_TANCI|nr:protein-lysine methyltransferase METTL21D [Tanacetum cinerariifolium]